MQVKQAFLDFLLVRVGAKSCLESPGCSHGNSGRLPPVDSFILSLNYVLSLNRLFRGKTYRSPMQSHRRASVLCPPDTPNIETLKTSTPENRYPKKILSQFETARDEAACQLLCHRGLRWRIREHDEQLC